MNVLEQDGVAGVPEGFTELPGLVYANEPLWIPEDPESVAAMFSADNAYFGGDDAALRKAARTFCIPGKVRCAAFHEPALRIDDECVAFFGFFESTGDAEANAAVMQRVEAWARERGARRLYGPIQFNTTTGYRLRLSAEPGALPFLGEPQNPESYPAMLEALGFTVHQKYVTQLIPFQTAQMALRMVEPLYNTLLSQGYRFETPTPEAWVRGLPQLYEMVDQVFSQNFAYSPVGYPAFQKMYSDALLRRVDPESSVMVTGPGGDLAGFALGYPHYGPITVQGAGADRVAARDLDYAIHWPRIAAARPRVCIGKTTGVHPAHRRKGLFESMVYYSFVRGHSRYDTWMGAMIREDNHSRKLFAMLAASERIYGLFAKPVL